MSQSFELLIRNQYYNKRIKWLVSTLFFFFLLILAVFIVPWVETWQTLLNSDLGLIGFAFFLFIPYQILLSTSYFLIAKQQSVLINFWIIFKINLILIFYDVVLPSTFIINGLRWFRFNQYSKKPGRTLNSIVYIKLFTILLTLLISIGFILLFNTSTLQGYFFELILLLLLIGLTLFFTPKISKYILSKLHTPAEDQNNLSAKSVFYKYLYRLIYTIADFRNINLKTLLLLILLGMASQGVLYYSYILFAESVGIHLLFSQLGAIIAVMFLVSSIPINFTVGISLREVSLVSLLVAINVPLEKAVAMSIVVLSQYFFYALIGGLIETINLISKRKTIDNVKFN